jgi:hypothetical protein
MPRLLGLVGVVLLIAGCVTTNPISEPTASAPPSSSAQPTSAPTATATTSASLVASIAPTASPSPGPTPTVNSNVVITNQKLIAWKPKYSSYVSYYVIAEITNEGSLWAQIDAFDSDYSVYDRSGKVTTTGNFLYAYPEFIAPGDTGYLIEDSVESGAVADFDTVDVNGRYSDADGPPDEQLQVSNTSVRSASFGGGWEVTGEVTNVGSVAADSAHAGAVYFNAAGEIIGASTTNLIQNVAPGQKKGFRTIDSNPLKKSQIDSYVVFASAEYY